MSWTSRDSVNRMIKRKMERNKIAKENTKNEDIESHIYQTINHINDLLIKSNRIQPNSLWIIRQGIYEFCKDLERRLHVIDYESKMVLDFTESEIIYDMRLKGINIIWGRDYVEKNNIEENLYIDITWGLLKSY